MAEARFDVASFYWRVGATHKERSALRQNLVRGLKDYFEGLYGYDRHGAETILLLPERMVVPHIFGYAALRILRDRRIADATKTAVAEQALGMAEYGADGGLPFGFFAVLHFLAQRDRLTIDNLRYALVISAGEMAPFRGLEKSESTTFLGWLLRRNDLPGDERLLWGHSLVARHQDSLGAADLVNELAGCDCLGSDGRQELCRAWINFRQPRLSVEIPARGGSQRSDFVAEHMGFWIAHSPSWPSHAMVRLGLIWLARLGEDPLHLASTYIAHREPYPDQLHAAVAEIIAEHHEVMPEGVIKSLIEQGVTMSSSITTRRKFYRLGTDLFGREYLERACGDTASSVRQWAAREIHKQR